MANGPERLQLPTIRLRAEQAPPGRYRPLEHVVADCSAREAPMAVTTFFSFSGGGRTAG
jgi:hypothetical protein